MKSRLTNRLSALEEEANGAMQEKVPPLMVIHDGRPGPTKEELQRASRCPQPPLHIVFVDKHGRRSDGKRVRKNGKERNEKQ